MKLSIVIVNYNVKYFLEQCLHAVETAIKKAGFATEVFVVDNNSVDGSCQMLRTKFPGVIRIENHENRGFSKANNQAIRQASGEYILLLNPDTVVSETTLCKTVEFMDDHPEAGGLGVKMIDGKGRFLPESKRSLPTPDVAFYKVFGLSKFFPRSRRFGRYHLGFLDKEETHEVQVLSGAFMLLRKSVLDRIGMLDEDYFMYGEDIDLSYRILKAGFKNYYFADTTIIHYKGESTKKGSINYVRVFYNAMLIFARKHFTKKRAGLLSLLIRLAIYFRASISILKRMVLFLILPLSDLMLILTGFVVLPPLWTQVVFGEPTRYPADFYTINLPAYITIWLISLFFSGAYESPVRLRSVSRGVLAGLLVILVFYSLLPVQMRFSRAIILLSTLWNLLTIPLWRYILAKTSLPGLALHRQRAKRILIVGTEAEAQRAQKIISQSDSEIELLGIVRPENLIDNGSYLGSSGQLPETARINNADEIVFCAKDITSRQIIELMLELSALKIEYKIAPPESVSIIGSNSIETAGQLYVVNFNTIAKVRNRTLKRLFDLAAGLIFLAGFPIFAMWIKPPLHFLRNIFKVLAGRYSWVGYDTHTLSEPKLPALKPGILAPTLLSPYPRTSPADIEACNIVYAKDYSLGKDILILLAGLEKIGQKPMLQK